MYLNFFVEDDQPHVTRTDASVVPASKYIKYPVFWVQLGVGTDSLRLGTKNPEHLAAMLREMADNLGRKAAEHAALPTEAAA